MKRIMLYLALTAALCRTAATAAPVVDFTKGRLKNVGTVKVVQPTWSDAGLSGSGAGGRVICSRLDLDADRIDRIELHAGGVEKAVLYFDADGKNFAETKKFRGAPAADGRIVFVTSGKKTWEGKIGALRFDLSPKEGGKFVVKKIAFREKVPGVPGEADFTLGAAGGWRVVGGMDVACRPDVGIAFSAEKSFRLVSPRLDLDAAKADVVEMELKLMTGKLRTCKLYFAAEGEGFAENRMVRGVVEDNVIVFELFKCPRFKGKFSALRIDVYPEDSSDGVIRKIGFRKSDGSSALRSPWRRPAAAAAGAVLRGECELRYPGAVRMTMETTSPLELEMIRFGVYGEELGRETYGFRQGSTVAEAPAVPRAAAMRLVVRNPGPKAAKFTLNMAQRPPAPEAKGRVVYAARFTNVPQNTDENTVWTPEIDFPGGSVPAGKRLIVRLRDGRGRDIIAADQLLDGNPVKLPRLTLRYLSAGIYDVTAEIDGVPVKQEKRVFTHERRSAVVLPTVRVDRSGSRPCYIVNGTEVAEPMEYLASDPPLSPSAFRQIFNAVDNGISSIRLRVIFRFTPEEKPDFGIVDSEIQTVLLRAPHVNLMLHVSVTDPGPGWREKHPEEGIRDDRGEFRILNYRPTPEATGSMASKRWLEDSQARLRELVGHISEIPGGERVIGVLPCSGITWEWLHWGSARGVMVDYSEHYRRYFAGFLRETYRGDLGALNAAHHSAYRSFDEVPIPRPERRRAADMTEFRTQEKFRPEIDLARSLAALITDDIRTLCGTIKEASGGRLLTGTYYGYTMYLNAAARAQNSGHFALTRLLNAPEVDIVMAPSRYSGRQIGGATGFMFPEGSLALHGKLVISECDDRPINADNGNGRADTMAGSRAVFERALGLQMSAGAVMRWFDFSKGWVMNDPRLLDVVKALRRYDAESRRSGAGAMPASATAAVFVCERSAAMLNPDSALQMMLLEDGYRALAHSGMSFRMFDVDDLAAASADRKLLIFTNCQYLGEAEKAAVRKAVAGRTVIVTSGLGTVADGGLDAGFLREIFGGAFRHVPERRKLSCRTTPEMEKLFGIPAGTEYRTTAECGDIFYPTGAEMVPLAVTPEGETAVAAVRKDGAWRIFIAHPILPPDLVRSVAERAGLPVVRAPGAAVWYGDGFGCVHTDAPVTATVELPPDCPGVVEYPDGRFLPAVSGRVSKKLQPVSTWLFHLKK